MIMQMCRVGHQRYGATRSGGELSTGMKEGEEIEMERETVVGSKHGELGGRGVQGTRAKGLVEG